MVQKLHYKMKQLLKVITFYYTAGSFALQGSETHTHTHLRIELQNSKGWQRGSSNVRGVDDIRKRG